MDKIIKKILEDIYAVDPKLRTSEDDLIAIIQELKDIRPNAPFDEVFRKTLFERLQLKISELKKQKIPAFLNKKFNIFSIITMKKMYYVLGSLVIASFIILSLFYSFMNKDKGSISLSFNQALTQVNEEAFGKLSLRSGEAPLGAGGGLGQREAASSVTREGPEDSAIAKGAAPMVIGPEVITNYRYIYTGETLILDKNKLEVLRRRKGIDAPLLSDFFKSFSLGSFDVNTFRDIKVQSLNFLEDRDYGYSIFVGFDEGIITISENWQRWNLGCRKGQCPEVRPLQLSDISEDTEFIALADAFMKEHQIDLTSYGKPQVSSDWKMYAATDIQRENFLYVPEIINVVYPLLISGQSVYDEGGNRFGIYVNINIREMKVSGVWNLQSQKYESSLYDAEMNPEKILSVAKRGGLYGFLDENDKNIVEIELGTPEVSFMKIWHYDGNESSELLVPALVFPIKNKPSDAQIYRNNIAVPLIKDILNEQPPNGPIQIMEKSLPEISR